jgi:hypothetical protein
MKSVYHHHHHHHHHHHDHFRVRSVRPVSMKPKMSLSFRRRSACFKCRTYGWKRNISWGRLSCFFPIIFSIKSISLIYIMSRIYGCVSWISVMTDYGLDDQNSISDRTANFGTASRLVVGRIQLPIQWMPVDVKRPERRGYQLTSI